jgi:mono/diheme cytochrome c family protein
MGMLRHRLIRPIFFWTLLGTALFTGACVTRPQELGKGLYNFKCAFCHGRDGTGNGPAAAAFNPGPVNFTNRNFWQGNVEQKIRTTILNGKGAMPAQNLDPEQIKAIIAYMSKTFN